MSDWKKHAEELAAETTHPSSRWSMPLATTPRHPFVPRWWARGATDWELRDGSSDQEAWMSAAYSNQSLVTRMGALHADQADLDAVADGTPTSSSTMPSLVVTMYRHALIEDGMKVLCVTGSGYGTALLCLRLGDTHVTSVDVDPYLVQAARERLDLIDLHPTMATCDITGPLPGEFDRIVSTVSVRPVPASWLAALRPGGRLVTTLADTGLIVAADRTLDGGAFGRVALDGAGFMRTRHGEDYEPDGLDQLFATTREASGEEVTTGRYPVLDVQAAWDIWSMLTLAVPGIETRYRKGDGNRRTAWLLHPDGSWARATAVSDEAPEVHQSGPRRLWDELERIRHRLNLEGSLPVYGAMVRITPDGETTLARGDWTATL